MAVDAHADGRGEVLAALDGAGVARNRHVLGRHAERLTELVFADDVDRHRRPTTASAMPMSDEPRSRAASRSTVRNLPCPGSWSRCVPRSGSSGPARRDWCWPTCWPSWHRLRRAGESIARVRRAARASRRAGARHRRAARFDRRRRASRSIPSASAWRNASSRFGPWMPCVPARPRMWQDPHFSAKAFLPATRSASSSLRPQPAASGGQRRARRALLRSVSPDPRRALYANGTTEVQVVADRPARRRSRRSPRPPTRSVRGRSRRAPRGWVRGRPRAPAARR